MIHVFKCNVCGFNFRKKDIEPAIANNDTSIECPSCGSLIRFNAKMQGHVDKGYDELSKAEFHIADGEFSLALDMDSQPTHDAYLGAALSQFRIQTVFKDDQTDNDPDFYFHNVGNRYFCESSYFRKAINATQQLDATVASVELDKLDRYAKKIDHFKDCYERFENENVTYDVFIAMEDRGKDAEENYKIALKVKNALPSKISRIFLPEIDNYQDETQYEAAILYAIKHSKSMIVVADSDMDFRLRSVYLRYFNDKPTNRKRMCFVKFRDTEDVGLPQNYFARLGDNLFNFHDGSKPYRDFICDVLGIISRDNEKENGTKEQQGGDEYYNVAPKQPTETTVYKQIDATHYQFGYYPQRQETSKAIVDVFKKSGLPERDNSNGWNTLYCDADNEPVAWYTDKQVGDKTYRGVYFVSYREQFLLHPRGGMGSQAGHRYMTSNLYCFEFQPITWKVVNSRRLSLELVTDVALDAQQFNGSGTDNSWENSHLRSWLNSEFLNTAFGECELDSLGSFENDDSVLILNQSDDKAAIKRGSRVLTGTDYFKCVGGSIIKNVINSYWIVGNSADSSEANVVYPSYGNEVTVQPTDCTSVAVLPKIVLVL